MLAREWHKTIEGAVESAAEHATRSGSEDVWLLTSDLWTSWPTSLRDLLLQLDPEAVMYVVEITIDNPTGRHDF